MRRSTFFIPFLAIICFTGCKLGEALMKTGDKFDKQIEDFKAELIPFDSATQHLVEGAIAGTVTEESKKNLDTLTKRISYGITNFLNEKLKDLDTRSVGSNLMGGVKDEFNSPAFRDSLKAVINHTFSDLRGEMSLTIESVFVDLSSEENKARLESLVASLFTDSNSEAMRSFLNNAISGLDFNPVADSLRLGLLNEDTRMALNNIFPPELDSVLNKIELIVNELSAIPDKINEGGGSFIERNIWTIILGVASLMLLGTLLFFWRRKNQESKMNDAMMSAIDNLKSSEGYDVGDLTDQIKNNAINKGIEAVLNKRLVELGIIENKRGV